MNRFVFLAMTLMLTSVVAADKPKYREGKKIDFESLLIEGQKKKPDYAVVTGNLGEKDLGLLKLREDFIDKMTDDIGEEVVK